MAFFINLCLGILFIAGLGTAIGVPLSFSANKTRASFGGGERSNSKSVQGGASSFESSQQSITFEELWERIEKDYKSKNSGDSNLLGKSNLQAIVLKDNSDSKIWSLSNQVGNDCKYDSRQMSIPCGYLHLKKSDVEYKLGIARDDSGKGKIKVVKKEGSGVSYYGNENSTGTSTGSTSSFEQLVSFDKNSQDAGRSYQDAIIFPLK